MPSNSKHSKKPGGGKKANKKKSRRKTKTELETEHATLVKQTLARFGHKRKVLVNEQKIVICTFPRKSGFLEIRFGV
jgi:hypothetical protein